MYYQNNFVATHKPKIPNRLNQPIDTPMMMGRTTIVNAMIANASPTPLL